MGHKFNVKNIHKLDNEKRRKAIPPYETLVELGLKKGDIMADIGCGIGYFSIPASKIVGEVGKVFALDISNDMLIELNKKIENNDINNIKTVLTEEKNLCINDQSVNFAFMCNVLHETEDMSLFLTEVKRILTEDGKLVIIEWNKERSDYGPPNDHRIGEEEVKKVVVKNGFVYKKIHKLGEYFYSVICTK